MNIWHISATSFSRRVITVLSPALNQMCMHCCFLPSQFSLLLQQMANRPENKNIVFLKVDVDDAGVSGFWNYFSWHKLEESSGVCSFFTWKYLDALIVIDLYSCNYTVYVSWENLSFGLSSNVFIHLLQLCLVGFNVDLFSPPGCERTLRHQVHAHVPVLQKWKQGKRFITWAYDPCLCPFECLKWARLRSVNLLCSSRQVDEFSGANQETLKEKLEKHRTWIK